MAAGQDTRTAIAPINPASLIGQSTPVEPRAVSALADAFRSGVITSQDIISRSDETARLRKKAEIQSLTEATSPEAQAARSAQQAAAVAQAELQAAQAGAQTPLVDPMAQLQREKIEAEMAYQRYPAAKVFDQYAPVLGLEEPKTPDKQIDWARKASIGAQIAAHIQARTEAKEKLDNIMTEKSPDGAVLAAFTKQGRAVPPEEVERLEAQARSPFSGLTPGATSATAGAATPPVAQAPVAAPTPQQRAQAVEQLGVAPERAAVMTGADFQNLVQPKAVPAPVQPTVEPGVPAPPTMGQRVPGGVSLGPPKAVLRGPAPPTDRQVAEELNNLEMDRQAVRAARNLIDQSANVVGPGAGSQAGQIFNQVGAALGLRTTEFESQDKLKQTINKRVLEGAQRLKGNLSDKDIRFLQESFPSLTSTEDTWRNFLNKWEQMIVLNEQVLRGTAPRGASVFDAASQQLPATGQQPAATTPGASGGVIGLPSTGRQIIRDANGSYRLIQ